MATAFERGDHVEWNSEAGLVRRDRTKSGPATSPTFRCNGVTCT